MSNMDDIINSAKALSDQASKLASDLAASAAPAPVHAMAAQAAVDPFIFGITVFVLACFVGYFVVWSVTPALHTPLMSVTNAISGIIIVGAIIAVGPEIWGTSKILGFAAVTLASINIFGGFIVTHRMLRMFRKK